MKIKKVVDRIRNDFWADMECEFCGHIERRVPGYNDANFYDNVIPSTRCPKCNQSTVKTGETV